MTSINPHYTPGMGHKMHTPLPKLAGRLDEVAARVKCGSVELKLTLTAKFLARTLRDALIEPFLKVHNKRAQPLTFEEFACVKLNGNTLDAFVDVVAGDVLKEPAVSVQLVPIAALPSSLLEGFLVAAREKLPARFTAEGYRIPPPPTLTEKLVSIAEAANSEDAASDADMARRDARRRPAAHADEWRRAERRRRRVCAVLRGALGDGVRAARGGHRGGSGSRDVVERHAQDRQLLPRPAAGRRQRER